jgi:hypothetical protein
MTAVVSAQEAHHGPEQRASGTALLPGETPTYAVHAAIGPWLLMLHGNVFAQYLNDERPRGVDQFGSINWFMAMVRRPAGRGDVGLSGMVSLEPWTIGGCGYPDLLATGERCASRTIVDRQHPHDLIMELAVSYEQPIVDGLSVEVYGGPAGEPALGPVAFPHRLSASPNPVAPISHHWLDATHISFGVLTAGIRSRRWKAEGSVFNGREPDEDRVGVDIAPLDSIAGRMWFLPSERLAVQVSAARLNDAEPNHGGAFVDVGRMTASASYHRFDAARTLFWATTIAWGHNAEDGRGSSFALAETSMTVDDRHTWFGRLELGAKEGHDLGMGEGSELVTVGKLQAGYARHFNRSRWLRPGLGAFLSAGFVPASLARTYGGRLALGFGVFATVGPGRIADDPHAGHVMSRR